MKTLRDLKLGSQRVLIRVDFNVPMEKGVVTDDTRMRASLPTINFALEAGARVILMSHLGRPKGSPNPKYSLAPVAKHLSNLLKKPVAFAPDCVGPAAENVVRALRDGDLALLENLRFHPEEEKNDLGFAKSLASLADVFIQDAFGAVHRAHASTAAVAGLLPCAAGFLLLRELEFLGKVKDHPARPFVAVVGGAKVSDKIEVLDKLLERVNTLVVGGAMAYTFLLARDVLVGDSLVEKDKLDLAKGLMEKASRLNVNLILPRDHVVVNRLDNPASAEQTNGEAIPEGKIGVDIGTKTIQAITGPLGSAQTIFWNGPMGIFETDAYARGTREVAKLAAEAASKGATVVVGGGDSVAAVQASGLADRITHISTGGGASLEFIEGKDLPGVRVLG